MNFECDFFKTMIFLTQTSNICSSASIKVRGLIIKKKKLLVFCYNQYRKNSPKNFSNLGHLFIDRLPYK